MKGSINGEMKIRKQKTQNTETNDFSTTMPRFSKSNRVVKQSKYDGKWIQMALIVFLIVVGTLSFTMSGINLFSASEIKSSKKLAFLFLTQHSVIREDIWSKFFDGIDSNLYNIYCYPKYLDKVRGRHNITDARSIISRKNIIPKRIIMNRGDMSKVDITNELLKYSYFNDPNNVKFIILSDSHIPIYNFSYIYNLLILNENNNFDDDHDDDISWMMDLKEDMEINIGSSQIYQDLLLSRWQQLDISQSDMESKHFISLSQWKQVSNFMILNRYSVKVIVNYLESIKSNSNSNKFNLINFDTAFENVFAAHQHYHVTLLQYLRPNFVEDGNVQFKHFVCQSFIPRKKGKNSNNQEQESVESLLSYKPRAELIQTVTGSIVRQWRQNGCIFASRIGKSAYVENTDFVVTGKGKINDTVA